MTNTIHISLDLETWGTRPGYDLRSIGACVFAPHARHGGSLVHDGSLGTIKPFYIATDNPEIDSPFDGYSNGDTRSKDYFDASTETYRKYPLARDPETVKWWNDQSEEAQAAFADPVELRSALVLFGDWLRGLVNDYYYVVSTDEKYDDDIRLWSHGAAFDPPILAAAYEACGLPVPWHYRAPRDTRTSFDMAGVDDHSTFLARFNTGTHHHALDDAICQAKAVCEAYRLYGARRYPDALPMVEIYSSSIFAGGLGASRPAIEAFARWLDGTDAPPATITEIPHPITDAFIKLWWPDMDTPEGRAQLRRQYDNLSTDVKSQYMGPKDA